MLIRGKRYGFWHTRKGVFFPDFKPVEVLTCDMSKFILSGLIVLLVGCRSIPNGVSVAARQKSDTAWILALSDIHLNKVPGPTAFDEDTKRDLWDWTLEKLDSILGGKGAWHKPAFILYTGDLPCHDKFLPDPEARQQMADMVRKLWVVGISPD